MRIARAIGLTLLVAVVVALAAAAAGWWWATATLHRPLHPERTRIEIPRGIDAREILSRLETAGLVVDETLARAYLVYVLGDPPLKAGEYELEGPISTVEVLDRLARGAVVQHLATVIEGLTLEETARALADAGFGDHEAFLAAMRDPAPIADLDPEAETLEGYLFPETYAFSRGITEEEIVRTMVSTFRETLMEEVLPAARESGWIAVELPEGARPAVEPGKRRPGPAGGRGEVIGEEVVREEQEAAPGPQPEPPGEGAQRSPAAAEEPAAEPEEPSTDREGPSAEPNATPTGPEDPPAERERPSVAPEGSPADGESAPDEPVTAPPDDGRKLTLTVRELVTLASIVEKEARLDEERALISGVYVNRLLAGMGLYADPTIIFALKLRGEWDGNLTRADLQLDSPYNTYRYAGLPPGPIASPGRGSLLAAVRPADVDHLYFVSRNDGSHVFSDTLREHNRNVRRWQKEYWRERWARERAEREAAAEEADGTDAEKEESADGGE